MDPRPHVALRADGLAVLAYVERITREKHRAVTAQELHEVELFHRLSEDDLQYILKFLEDYEYFVHTNSGLYHLTKIGRRAAIYHTTNGKVELEFTNPHAGGTQVHVGQGATSAFQANIHTGSGNLTATQNIHVGLAQQAEILQVLARLTEVLDNMEASTDRDTAATIVSTAADAAQKGAWDIFKGRMHGALSIISMLASAGADGPEALELAQKALTLISGGT